MKCDDACLDVIGNLGKKDNIEERTFIDIERFICQLYEQGTCIKTMKELRWCLFSKRQWTDEKLPPTKDALSQVIKRANYVALSWKNCGQPFQTLPSPEQHGWVKVGEQLLPVACNTAPAPSSVMQLVKCSCKGLCATRVCSCKKQDLQCTDMCKCSDNKCANRDKPHVLLSDSDTD